MRPHHVEPAPGSTSSLRTANQRRVLDVLRGVTPVAPLDNGDTESAFTQAELARATGLAPATVSNIVRELTASGLVEADPGSGRRGSAVRLARGRGSGRRRGLRPQPRRRGGRRPDRPPARRGAPAPHRRPRPRGGPGAGRVDAGRDGAGARAGAPRRPRAARPGDRQRGPVLGDLPGLGGRRHPRGRRAAVRRPGARGERRQPRRAGRAQVRRRRAATTPRCS